MLLLFWRNLGWDLGVHKAQLARSINWIGFSVTVDSESITVKVKQEFMREFRDIVKHAMKQRWLAQDAVRSLAGKANHIANVLYSWRPFLSELWGALNAKNKATAPGGSIWLKQIAPALKWMKCFMSGHSGSLPRQLYFKDILFQVVEYSIILDASPWGLGGILMEDGVIISWFSSRLTKHGERQFHHTIGQADGQQVWETLCLVVALRLWLPRWKNRRVNIALKKLII